MKILTADAEQGVAEAQFFLGVMYKEGQGVSLDYNEALKWYRLAAKQGYGAGKANIYRLAKYDTSQALKILTSDAEQGVAEAQVMLGKMHEEGHHFPKNYIIAFNWYKRAATQGNVPGKLHLYKIAKKGVPKALKILIDDARRGVAQAQFHLGFMYKNGHQFPQDNDEAFRWYQLSANQGYVHAQLHLGQMYEKGEAVPQNYDEAVRRYRFGAEIGIGEAQFRLGLMYYKGQGVPQDYVLADMWFILSSIRKIKEATKYRSLVENKMSPQQIEKAQLMARN